MEPLAAAVLEEPPAAAPNVEPPVAEAFEEPPAIALPVEPLAVADVEETAMTYVIEETQEEILDTPKLLKISENYQGKENVVPQDEDFICYVEEETPTDTGFTCYVEEEPPTEPGPEQTAQSSEPGDAETSEPGGQVTEAGPFLAPPPLSCMHITWQDLPPLLHLDLLNLIFDLRSQMADHAYRGTLMAQRMDMLYSAYSNAPLGQRRPTCLQRFVIPATWEDTSDTAG